MVVVGHSNNPINAFSPLVNIANRAGNTAKDSAIAHDF
jgi:hypothetical protein